MKFIRIFAGFNADGTTNRGGAAKIRNLLVNAASFLGYREMCGRS